MKYRFKIKFVQNFWEIAAAWADEIPLHLDGDIQNLILRTAAEKNGVESVCVDILLGKSQGTAHERKLGMGTETAFQGGGQGLIVIHVVTSNTLYIMCILIESMENCNHERANSKIRIWWVPNCTRRV